jgi:hypothetical protein
MQAMRNINRTIALFAAILAKFCRKGFVAKGKNSKINKKANKNSSKKSSNNESSNNSSSNVQDKEDEAQIFDGANKNEQRSIVKVKTKIYDLIVKNVTMEFRSEQIDQRYFFWRFKRGRATIFSRSGRSIEPD